MRALEKRGGTMIDLRTKLARAAWDLGPTSKSLIPDEIMDELVGDFRKQHPEITIKSIEKIEELNTFTVTIDGRETLDLYADWMATFEVHGYEAPFLVVDNGDLSE